MSESSERLDWRSPAVVLACCGAILTATMGVRHGLGMFLAPISQAHGWGREVFSFALAVQNLVWGLAQPFTGAIADRFGTTRVMISGGLLYGLGMILMAFSPDGLALSLSAGVLIGLGLSGTTFSIIFGAVNRAFAPERRSKALGIASAAGSFGQFLMLPLSNALIDHLGWQYALVALSVPIFLALPLTFALSPAKPNASVSRQRLGDALVEAATHRGFLLLCLGYFVCGFQVTFIGTHLPSYLLDRGLTARDGAYALALIGLFNILGSYTFGLLGGRLRKKYLLCTLYLLRGIAIAGFLMMPVTAFSAALFAATIGFLWLSTVPLTNGIVGEIFGLKYFSMLSGIVFLGHQIGSFLGVWLGGRLYDVTGSYQWVWLGAIGLSLIAAVVNLPIDDREIERRSMVLTG